MSKIWYQTPIYFFTVVFLALFFLSCTKKPATQVTSTGPTGAQPRVPANVPGGMFTTSRGYKVQLEPVQFGTPPQAPKSH